MLVVDKLNTFVRDWSGNNDEY